MELVKYGILFLAFTISILSGSTANAADWDLEFTSTGTDMTLLGQNMSVYNLKFDGPGLFDDGTIPCGHYHTADDVCKWLCFVSESVWAYLTITYEADGKVKISGSIDGSGRISASGKLDTAEDGSRTINASTRDGTSIEAKFN